MASVNKVILVGNLGADPEVRFTASGDAICNLRLATSDSWKDKSSGERREVTEWHRVVLYRRLAEVARDYLKKGMPVYVEGRLRTRKWQDRDGKERYSTEIEGDELTLLGSKNASAANSDTPEFAAQPRKPAAPTVDLPWLDDLPF